MFSLKQKSKTNNELPPAHKKRRSDIHENQEEDSPLLEFQK